MTLPRDPPAAAAAQYRAARQDAVLVDRSDLGRLFVSGNDALDLLHRLTTQDISSLKQGQGTAAAFVTAKGRLIDWVTLHSLDERLLCLTSPGRSTAVADYIDRYTFREAVRVENADRSHGTLGLFGARVRERVANLFGESAAQRPLHHPVQVTLAGSGAVLARTFPLAGDGYHLTSAAGELPLLRAAILERSAGLVEADQACLEILRIEAGLPAAGRELTEDYNPWEARLNDAISLNKGCYVGQEVVARLNTYRKVSKYLVRLRVEAGVPQPGARLVGQRDEVIGTLTSVAAVPGEARVLGLGYVRDEEAAEGRELSIVDGERIFRAVVLGPAR
jgi:tRNA-modifying protein YgfZ